MAVTTVELTSVILFHRKQAKLSRADLSRIAGVGKTTIYDVEHGKATVRLDSLLRILKVLNVRLDWSSPLREAYEARARLRS